MLTNNAVITNIQNCNNFNIDFNYFALYNKCNERRANEKAKENKFF